MFYLEQTGTTTARTPGVHEEGIIYQIFNDDGESVARISFPSGNVMWDEISERSVRRIVERELGTEAKEKLRFRPEYRRHLEKFGHREYNI